MSLASRLSDLPGLMLDESADYPAMVAAALKKPAPASSVLGLELLGCDPSAGTVQMAFEAGEHLQNKWGGIQGGMVAAMLDEAVAFAAGLGLDWGQIVPTLEMKTSFIEAARPGRLYAEGRCLRRGKSILFLEADLENAEGRLLARATGTASVVTLKKKS